MAEPGVRAYFYKNAVLHGFQSQQEGRPIYIDQDWVTITVAGMDKDIIKRKATPADKERFADEWAAYERGQQQTRSGTPLDLWPRMTPGMVATLKGLNIMSVEDMATLSDLGCQKIGMGGYELRKDAQTYLNSAAQASAAMAAERLQEENDALKSEVADLKALVQKMIDTQARAVVPAEPEPEKARRRKATA